MASFDGTSALRSSTARGWESRLEEWARQLEEKAEERRQLLREQESRLRQLKWELAVRRPKIEEEGQQFEEECHQTTEVLKERRQAMKVLEERRQEVKDEERCARQEVKEHMCMRREIEEASQQSKEERRKLDEEFEEARGRLEEKLMEGRQEVKEEERRARQEVKEEERHTLQEVREEESQQLKKERHKLEEEFEEARGRLEEKLEEGRQEVKEEQRRARQTGQRLEMKFEELLEEFTKEITEKCHNNEQRHEHRMELHFLEELREERHKEAQRFHEERHKHRRELDELLEKGRREVKEEQQRLKAEFQESRAGAQATAHIAELGSCGVYEEAARAFASLRIDERLLDRLHDRCYCCECYHSTFPDVIKNDGPQAYVVPRGWVRFGLKVPVHAEVHDVWKKWCVSFHGTKLDVAKCIVGHGEFLMPGDTLPDGSVLGSVNCGNRTDKKTYTSPTVNYAGLAFYAHPAAGPGDLVFQVVLQCRQKPGTFMIQPETLGFREQRKRDLCPHVRCDQIEWVSETRKSIIPYGLLIRTFKRSHPPGRYFRCPRDDGRF